MGSRSFEMAMKHLRGVVESKEKNLRGNCKVVEEETGRMQGEDGRSAHPRNSGGG